MLPRAAGEVEDAGVEDIGVAGTVPGEDLAAEWAVCGTQAVRASQEGLPARNSQMALAVGGFQEALAVGAFQVALAVGGFQVALAERVFQVDLAVGGFRETWVGV
jgi:hypothetical protein